MIRGVPSFSVPSSSALAARVLMGVGLVSAAAGLLIDPNRTWSDGLVIGCYLIGIGLAGLFFVALQYATGDTWSIAFRRVPEAMAATLPAGVGVVAITLVASAALYPWTAMTITPEEGVFRQMWLIWPFFLARAAVYVAIWAAFARAILRASRRQDEEGGFAQTDANIRLSIAFLVLFGLTYSLASFDWVMSREPHFSSTIFAVYNFAGLFSSGLAVLIILAVWLREAGPLRGVLRDDHLHDLGKLLFAFSTFWMYIWFSQYMLIWYANIPEEAVYFVDRTRGTWAPLFFLNVALNWAIPFVVLLRRDTKRQGSTLVKVAAAVLFGRWLDLYLMILPPTLGAAPRAGLLELGLTAGGAGLFAFALFRALKQAPLVPIGDPMLMESLHYHS